jgi:hypothetical protein
MSADLQVAPGRWRWFLAWLGVGAIASVALLGMASIGIFLVPVAAAAAALVHRASKGRGHAGLLSGLGVPLFYVAYLNRMGPGNICTANADGGQSCGQYWNPWAWAGAGVGLSAAGILLFVIQRRHDLKRTTLGPCYPPYPTRPAP